MSVDAVGDPWTPDDIAGWAAPPLADARWVLVAGLLRSHFPAPTVAALAGEGRRLLLDAQGIVRVARVGPLERNADIDRAVLAHLAVLKLNEDEARILAGALDAESLLALGVPEVVLTLGSEGARIVTPELDTAIPPHPVAAANPTGAGDAFSLVYLDGRERASTRYGRQSAPRGKWQRCSPTHDERCSSRVRSGRSRSTSTTTRSLDVGDEPLDAPARPSRRPAPARRRGGPRLDDPRRRRAKAAARRLARRRKHLARDRGRARRRRRGRDLARASRSRRLRHRRADPRLARRRSLLDGALGRAALDHRRRVCLRKAGGRIEAPPTSRRTT